MGQKTTISWCDSTSNPMMGCNGCELWQPKTDVRTCYAAQLTARYAGRSNSGWPRSFDQPRAFEGRLEKTFRWSDLSGTKRPTKPWLNGLPRVIFLCDMGDPFTEDLTKSWEDFWFRPDLVEQAAATRHQYLLLTKRPRLLAQWSIWLDRQGCELPENIWLGTSISSPTQRLRWRSLLEARGGGPRFLSIEPELKPVEIPPEALGQLGDRQKITWVIWGGESGRSQTAPAEISSARRHLVACRQAGAAFFLKQLGSRWKDEEGEIHRAPREDSKAEDLALVPEDLQVREMPIAASQGWIAAGELMTFEEAREHYESVCCWCGRPLDTRGRYEGPAPAFTPDYFCPSCGYPCGGLNETQDSKGSSNEGRKKW